jgi:hypothetical protein
MESPIQMKDFIKFEDDFKKLSSEVKDKKVRDELISEDLVQAF